MMEEGCRFGMSFRKDAALRASPLLRWTLSGFPDFSPIRTLFM
jgi:hypothetical protein